MKAKAILPYLLVVWPVDRSFALSRLIGGKMRFNVYCVRDKVAEICSPPNFAVNHGVASRQFVNLMAKVAPHDRDAYELWFLGSWNDFTAIFDLNDEVEVINVSIPRFSDIEQRNFGFSEEDNG